MLDQNFVSNVSADWNFSDQLGSFTSLSGISTIFDASKIGNTIITATNGNLQDNIIISISGGAIHYIQIRDQELNIIDNVTLTQIAV